MTDISTSCALTTHVAQKLKRRVKHTTDPESSNAAVLIPVVRAAEPAIVFTRRAQHLNSHAGEVAFPGGKRDVEDLSLQAAALRETEEEIGVPKSAVDVVSALPQVTSRFGVTVTPFLGFIDEGVTFKPSPDEIDSIFIVPIGWLSTQTNVQFQEFPGGQVWPFYEYTTHNVGAPFERQTYRIWGITARILTNVLNVAFDAKLTL